MVICQQNRRIPSLWSALFKNIHDRSVRKTPNFMRTAQRRLAPFGRYARNLLSNFTRSHLVLELSEEHFLLLRCESVRLPLPLGHAREQPLLLPPLLAGADPPPLVLLVPVRRCKTAPTPDYGCQNLRHRTLEFSHIEIQMSPGRLIPTHDSSESTKKVFCRDPNL